jgi:hypothetical protein
VAHASPARAGVRAETDLAAAADDEQARAEHVVASPALPQLARNGSTSAGRRPAPRRPELDGVRSALPELAALLATLAIQLGHNPHGRPVHVLGDRPPRSGFPLLVGGFWRVCERLRSPEHASKPARHPDFATPRLLLSIRHHELLSVCLILRRSGPERQRQMKLVPSRHWRHQQEALAGILLLAREATDGRRRGGDPARLGPTQGRQTGMEHPDHRSPPALFPTATRGCESPEAWGPHFLGWRITSRGGTGLQEAQATVAPGARFGGSGPLLGRWLRQPRAR